MAELLLKLRLSDNRRRAWLEEICRGTKRLASPARDLPDVNEIQVGCLAVLLDTLPLYQAVEMARTGHHRLGAPRSGATAGGSESRRPGRRRGARRPEIALRSFSAGPTFGDGGHHM